VEEASPLVQVEPAPDADLVHRGQGLVGCPALFFGAVDPETRAAPAVVRTIIWPSPNGAVAVRRFVGAGGVLDSLEIERAELGGAAGPEVQVQAGQEIILPRPIRATSAWNCPSPAFERGVTTSTSVHACADWAKPASRSTSSTAIEPEGWTAAQRLGHVERLLRCGTGQLPAHAGCLVRPCGDVPLGVRRQRRSV